MIRRIILSFILSILVLTASAQVYFKTVTVIQPGTLKTLLGERLDTITALKVNGSINGTDFVTLRLLAGYDKYHIPDLVEGSLRLLDLSDACIVEGGENYDVANIFGTKTISSRAISFIIAGV